MSQEFVKLEEFTDDTVFYGTGNIVFTNATDRIGITGIGTYAPVDSRLIITSAEDAANDGTWTVKTKVSADIITVGAGGTVTVNADDDSAVIKGQTAASWHNVGSYSRIVGIISSDQDVTVTFEWASDTSGTGKVTVSYAVTGGTPLSTAVEVLATHLRIRVTNNDNTTATFSGTYWAKAIT
jgi:hypothetical protein